MKVVEEKGLWQKAGVRFCSKPVKLKKTDSPTQKNKV